MRLNKKDIYYKLFFGSLVVIFLPKTYMFSIVFMRENRIKLIKINLKLNFIYFFNSDYQYLSLILHTKYKDNLFEKLYDSIVIFWTYFIEKNHKQVHPTKEFFFFNYNDEQWYTIKKIRLMFIHNVSSVFGFIFWSNEFIV